MNVVDSSGWLEYFADAPNAEFFAPAVLDVRNLVVPAIALLEVFRRVYQQRGENAALAAVASMRQGMVVPLDGELAVAAAKLGVDLRLPLADSVMLATARRHRATLWTQDADSSDWMTCATSRSANVPVSSASATTPVPPTPPAFHAFDPFSDDIGAGLTNAGRHDAAIMPGSPAQAG